tara:strand:+ start:1631 stop:2059 length:429 start_codon:yes stop_codon:yes gene_type:complete
VIDMARIHADPVSTSLMHPTRRALYVALLDADEYTTVQLQKIVGVDRYNLYHHLRKLESLGLVMNHRDQGRTRWWCVIDRVPLPSDGSIETANNSLGSIDLSNPRVQAAARTMLRELLDLSGSNLSLETVSLESLEIIGRKN